MKKIIILIILTCLLIPFSLSAYIAPFFDECKQRGYEVKSEETSEGRYYNKDYSIPIKKHFEQTLNALFIRENSYGEFYTGLKVKNIRKFLKGAEKYRKKKLKRKSDLLDKLEKTIRVIKK